MSECAAVETGEGFECDRCALAWDARDARPPCAAVTFTRLRDAALDEADRIEQSQRALVAAGLRAFRHQPRLMRAMELRRLAALVDTAKAATKGEGKR